MALTSEQAREMGRKGGRSDHKRKAWENIVGWLVGDGGLAFKKKIEELSKGKEISKPEQEFLNHYKDLLEFHQPKLARQEITGKDGEEFKGVSIYLPANAKASVETPGETGKGTS